MVTATVIAMSFEVEFKLFQYSEMWIMRVKQSRKGSPMAPLLLYLI